MAFFGATIFALIPFFRGKLTLKFAKPQIKLKEIIQIIKNGGPTFINNVAGRLVGLVFNFLLLKEAGENGVNAYGIIMSLEAFVLPLMYGTCDSLQPATGYNYGAGKYKRVIKIQRMAFISTLIICILSFVLMLIFKDNFAHIYMDENIPGSIAIAKRAILIYAFTYLTRWLSYAGQSFFASLSYAKESMLISLCISFISPLVFIFIFINLGIDGIWLNFPVSSFCVAILTIILLIIQCQRNILFTKKD